MLRLLALLALLAALAGCGARSTTAEPVAQVTAQAEPPAQAVAPVVAAAAAPPPAAVLLPTVAPPTATAEPTAPPATVTVEPTAAPPATATAEPTAPPATATVEPTAVPTTAPAPAAPARPAAEAAVRDPVRLVIPAIQLDRSLLSVGLDANRFPVVPNHDVGWYNLSAGPGEGENIVLWGHVLRFRETPKIPAPFARLKDLAVGAELTLYSADGAAHRYVVVERVWATPEQIQYILPRGRELVTLVSCIGDKVVVDGSVELSHRLITIAAPAEG